MKNEQEIMLEIKYNIEKEIYIYISREAEKSGLEPDEYARRNKFGISLLEKSLMNEATKNNPALKKKETERKKREAEIKSQEKQKKRIQRELEKQLKKEADMKRKPAKRKFTNDKEWSYSEKRYLMELVEEGMGIEGLSSLLRRDKIDIYIKLSEIKNTQW